MSGKRLNTVDPWARWLVELAGREDQRACLMDGAALGLDAPAAAFGIPRAGGSSCVRLHQAIDLVRTGDLVQVSVDLCLWGAQARPVPALRKRERVQVTWHIARGSRIAVVEPRAAQVGGLLEDRYVGDPVAAQLDRGGDAAKAGANDQDLGRATRGRLWTRRCACHATPPPRPAWLFATNLMPSAAMLPTVVLLWFAQGDRGASWCASVSFSQAPAAGIVLGSMWCPASDSWYSTGTPAARNCSAAARAKSTLMTWSRVPCAMNTRTALRAARSGCQCSTDAMKPENARTPMGAGRSGLK